MRIAHVISTPSGIGGAERVMRALVEGGANRGHMQEILNPFVARGVDEPAIGDGLDPSLLRSKECEHIWELPALRGWLMRSLRAFKPDIVHTHLFHAQVAVASIERGPQEKRVLTHHHGSLLKVQGKAYERWLDRRTGSSYDKIIAVSVDVAEFLVTDYRYDPSQILTILNGWEGDPLPDRPSHEHPIIVSIANLRLQKGHGVLIDAFASVVETLPDARLVLVGEGELRSSLEKQIEKAGLTSRVTFKGAVANVWPILRDCDVFVLASLYEPLGIAVMEAMAAGLPIVATAVGGIPELIQEGVTGTLVPPQNPQALAEALVGLLRDRERRDRLGSAARIAAQEFKMDRMVESYMVLYDELVRSEL